MAESEPNDSDLEGTGSYVHGVNGNVVGLEPVDSYIKRVRARIRLFKARAASTVAYMLVGGFVISLPIFALAAAFMPADRADRIATVFTKWYDVIAPLVGAVVGGLFGMSVAGRQNDE